MNRHFGNMHGGLSGKDEWLTPPGLIKSLGEFDLDPCAPVVRPWPTAVEHYTIEDDGLSRGWFGRVWLNPPYGGATWKWVRRLAEHGNGIALIYARTETKGFHEEVWEKATGILFLKGRLRFYHVDGSESSESAGAPSCLVAYGYRNYEVLRDCGLGYTTILEN